MVDLCRQRTYHIPHYPDQDKLVYEDAAQVHRPKPMTTPPGTPTSPHVAADGTSPSAQGPTPPAGAPGPSSPTGGGTEPAAGAPLRRAPRLPSFRASAALAAGMLTIGVAVGAAIGPAPSASLAGEQVAPLVLRSIAGVAARSSGAHASTQAIEPPPSAPQATPASGGAGASTPPRSPSRKHRRARACLRLRARTCPQLQRRPFPRRRPAALT